MGPPFPADKTGSLLMGQCSLPGRAAKIPAGKGAAVAGSKILWLDGVFYGRATFQSAGKAAQTTGHKKTPQGAEFLSRVILYSTRIS